MSRLQSPGDYHREIEEVERMLEVERSLTQEVGGDFASELSMSALESRLEALQEELEARGDENMPRHELSVVFEGRPVHNHTVDASFLAEVLRDVQRVVQSLVASAAGATGRRGRLSEEVRRRSTLRFAGSFPGSFGMRLETAIQELELEDRGSVAFTLDQLVELLHAGASTDDNELVESLGQLNSRARASYMAMLEHLQSSGAAMRVQWPSARGLKSARIGPRQASRALSRLRQLRVRETIATYQGVLDGAVKTRGVFEFRTPDEGLLSGRVAESALPQLREFFDSECYALISTKEVTDEATGDVTRHHILEGLRPVE